MNLQAYTLSGKTALVCAASQGLGLASAMALAQAGAQVLLCSRNEARLQQAADRLRTVSAVSPLVFAANLDEESSRVALAHFAQSQLGHIDIVVHNCGGPTPITAQAASLADWQAGFSHVFLPVVHLNQLFLESMRQRQWGRIVAITSIAGREPAARLVISNALRAGLQGYLKTLADEVTQFGITVNTVAPGYIATERLDELYQGPDAVEKKRQAMEAIPAKAFGEPEDIGHAVAFLASDAAKYVSGTSLLVDGSRHRFLF